MPAITSPEGSINTPANGFGSGFVPLNSMENVKVQTNPLAATTTSAVLTIGQDTMNITFVAKVADITQVIYLKYGASGTTPTASSTNYDDVLLDSQAYQLGVSSNIGVVAYATSSGNATIYVSQRGI